MPPKTRTRVGAGPIARARKPSGRLNKDDLKNAQKSLKLYPNDSLARKTAIKVNALSELDRSAKGKAAIRKYLKAKGATTAQIRDALSPYAKKAFNKKKSIQSKGPVGTKLKKVSKLGK